MTILLETRRLLIRESSADNFENVFSLFSDPEVMRYVGRGVMTREEAHERLEKMIQHQKKHGFAFGDVYEKETSLYVGRAGLIYLEMDDEQPEVEVGYLLHKDYWRKGYATELAKSLIHWGFHHLALKKIVAVFHLENEASRRVLEKANMSYVGKAFHYNVDVGKYEIHNQRVNPKHVEWIPASIEMYPIIQNLSRFYAYDMSQYMTGRGWEVPRSGLYDYQDFKKYWERKDIFPFLIQYEGEIAGFVILGKNSDATHIDYNMLQFYVLRKFSGRGLGSLLAKKAFDQFSGCWEVGVKCGNEVAYRFWRSVIKQYTHGGFLEYSRKDNENMMNFFEFKSR